MAEHEAAHTPHAGEVSILFVGDLVGSIGRHTLLDCLPVLRERYSPTFVVVNGENVAGGLGITPKVANELFRNDVDAITLGNHAYHRREIYSYLETEERIVRPFNYLQSQPGRGLCVVEKNGVKLGVVNLSGNLFLKAGFPAFTAIETAMDKLDGQVDHILVDMHAEATSEKVAMAHHLDGRVTAVVGTHTHVQTADARVFPRGTAYVTDLGMTGPHDSVIGVRAETILQRFLTGSPGRFEPADGGVLVQGAVVEADPATGRATSIATFSIEG
jgi:2',3'-cyclic-nucleotide 2'-phosphodiesterase